MLNHFKGTFKIADCGDRDRNVKCRSCNNIISKNSNEKTLIIETIAAGKYLKLFFCKKCASDLAAFLVTNELLNKEYEP